MARSPLPLPSRVAAPSRRRLGLRAVAGVLVVTAGLVAVACSSDPNRSASGDPSTESTVTTADPANGATTISQTLRLQEIAGGFAAPTAMVNRPMRNQLWVAERGGRIRVISIDTAWNLETGVSVHSGYTTYPDAVLDISRDVDGAEGRGIRGIAFSTDARTLFVDYVDERGEIVVASWSVTDPPPTPPTTEAPPAPAAQAPGASTTTTRARPTTTSTTLVPDKPVPVPVVDTATRRVLLTVAHPGSTHYGGQLALGRDGFLYIGIGDASKAGDANAAAQDTEALVGKILRIDPATPSMGAPYGIPSTNPFVDGGGAAQVYISGVHDALHFSFDRATGDLWVGDPGTDRFEEIDLLTEASGGGAGADLGWPLAEGTEKVTGGDVPGDLVAPLLAYRHTEGSACEIVGGYVYRGAQMANLQGVYVYGDRCAGSIRGLLQKKGRVADDRALGASLPADALVGFGQDDQGELYVISSAGSISRLAPA